MMLRCIAILLTASLTLAPSAGAQLVVRVESNGVPVYGAEVTAWSDSGRVALGRTDGAGIVRLPVSRELTPIGFVTARRVGFAPGRVSFPAADSVTVWLIQRTTALPRVTVTARPLRCPAESEDEALALWHRAAARYAAGQDTMPFSYLGSVAEETVGHGARLRRRADAENPRRVGALEEECSRFRGAAFVFLRHLPSALRIRV